MFLIPALAVANLPTTLSERTALIIAGLCQAVAARGAKTPAMQPLVFLIWRRLRRMVARFDAVAARVRAGSLAGAPVRPDATAPAPDAPTPHPPAARVAAVRSGYRLPHGFAWLIRLVPETAVYGSQLQHLLGDPELAALLAAEPKLGRILRPLCRMLAIHPGPDIPAAPHPAKPPPRKATPQSNRGLTSSGRPADAPACALAADVPAAVVADHWPRRPTSA